MQLTSTDLYYEAFPNDRLVNKCLVYTVYTLELVQTILITQAMFATFGFGFGDPGALVKANFAWLAVPIMAGLGIPSYTFSSSIF